MKIYLAGGFVTDWQQSVKDALSLHEHVEFLDPRDEYVHDRRNYTPRNIEMIKECDMVFAYMEADNPGWANVAFQLGYAIALGKPCIFVNEKRRKYAEMLHTLCDSPASFDAALAELPLRKELLA